MNSWNSVRNGKIARLPRAVREELNRRMRDGEMGKQLVAWLNALPEVQRMMAAQFGGRAVRAQNLSEWRKRGGYREWAMREEAWEVMRQGDYQTGRRGDEAALVRQGAAGGEIGGWGDGVQAGEVFGARGRDARGWDAAVSGAAREDAPEGQPEISPGREPEVPLENGMHPGRGAGKQRPGLEPPTLSDTLARWVLARYAVAARWVDAAQGKEQWRLLREMSADVVALRRGEQRARRMEMERERKLRGRNRPEVGGACGGLNVRRSTLNVQLSTGVRFAQKESESIRVNPSGNEKPICVASTRGTLVHGGSWMVDGGQGARRSCFAAKLRTTWAALAEGGLLVEDARPFS